MLYFIIIGNLLNTLSGLVVNIFTNASGLFANATNDAVGTPIWQLLF